MLIFLPAISKISAVIHVTARIREHGLKTKEIGIKAIIVMMVSGDDLSF